MKLCVALVGVGLVLSGCIQDKPILTPAPVATVSAVPIQQTAPPASTETEDAVPAPQESTACRGELPAAKMIADNIADTELTGIGEILKASVMGTDGSSVVPTQGYVNFVYEVRVLRQFAGPAHDQLVLVQGAEAWAKPQPPGVLLFFSACSAEQGGAFEPDVGYFFPIDAECRPRMEAFAAAAAAEKKRYRGDSRKKAAACLQ